MGQQQLLLVILVTIIVGIATVVAINTFGTAADQANIDAVTNDVATLASAAQGYFMRPGMLGGGGRTFDGSNADNDGLTFNGLAFPATAFSADDLRARNENGIYDINVTAPDLFTITAWPASCTDFDPGTVATSTDPEPGTLTGGGGCAESERITAEVRPNSFAIVATPADPA